MWPVSPGRAERHGFDYFRHVTLSLYATLDVKSGKVQGKTAGRHTSEEFVYFLDQVVAPCPTEQEIHIILDSLSAYKPKKVQTFLEERANVRLHLTPRNSSWLNQVEMSRIEREVIARDVFTSAKDSSRKLMRYIRAYSGVATAFRWKYSDVRHRIHAKELTATGHCCACASRMPIDVAAGGVRKHHESADRSRTLETVIYIESKVCGLRHR